MRKVLEITFSGEDFRVVTADGSQSAMGKLSENPQVFVVDTVLGGEDGYALAKQIRQRNPGAPIIMLASRYAPYDQARGRDAGADDWADKPFDTQQLIDKIRKVILAKEAGGQAAAVAPSSPVMQGGGAPYRAPAQQAPPAPSAPQPAMTPPMAASQNIGGSGGLGRGAPPPANQVRTGTLVFGESPVSPAPYAPAPSAPAVHAPAPPPPR